MHKKRVALLFGGKSAEHEVSLQSAKNVYEALPKDKYDVFLIGIDKKGRWKLQNPDSYLLNANDPEKIQLNTSERDVVVLPGDGDHREIVEYRSQTGLGSIDVVFPVLHGTNGEDGTVQGMLQLFDLPYVGAGVLGSAVAMDKDVAKRLMRDAGLPVPKFVVLRKGEEWDTDEVIKKLGFPVFTKPANLGSSVGITKSKTRDELEKNMQLAFSYDDKIILEEFIEGRELECAVLGNEEPEASIVGEVVLSEAHEFYTYDAKYVADDVKIETDLDIPKETLQQVQELSKKAFKILECSGMARVELFLSKNGKVYLNEVNTIPGFTSHSIYPSLWKKSGLSYPDLCSRLIELAIEKHDKRSHLKTNRE